MLSVNTNPGAMQAQQAFASASAAAAAVGVRVSTGLKVARPRDDPATWAIAQRMRSKIADLKAVGEGLDRGLSILDVGASATSAVADLVRQIRAKLLSYADTSLDSASKAAIQADVQGLVKQIDRTVQGADFDGKNIVDVPGGTPVPINLAAPSGPQAYDTSVTGVLPGPGTVSLDMTWSANDSYLVDLNGQFLPYVGGAHTGHQVYSFHTTASTAAIDLDAETIGLPPPSNPPLVTVNSATFTPDAGGRSSFQLLTDDAGGTVSVTEYDLSSSGLGLSNLDWSDPEGMLSAADWAGSLVNGAATQIGADQNTVSGLKEQTATNADVLQAGVGDLVDANLGQESANLQAAQSKQALAAQALAIANAEPRILLSLFR
jgi:flagellin